VPAPLEAAKRAAILAAIRAGALSRNAIARQFEVSAGSVTNIARQEGVEHAFDRARTRAPTAAAVFDAKVARQVAMRELYGDFERFRARAWEPYTQVFTGPSGPELVTTKLPPLRDQQAGYVAAAVCLDKALALERHDGDDGSTAGKTMINDLFGALRLAYHQLATEEEPAPVDSEAA
jgi:hypothetical protein